MCERERFVSVRLFGVCTQFMLLLFVIIFAKHKLSFSLCVLFFASSGKSIF